MVAEGAKKRRHEASLEPSRPVPLLAMPLFGTEGGGAGLVKGDVIRLLLNETRSVAAVAGVDVLLVLANEKTFALVQELLKRELEWRAPLKVGRTSASLAMAATDVEIESLGKREHLDQASILRSIHEKQAEPGSATFNQTIADLIELKLCDDVDAVHRSLGPAYVGR